MELKLNREVFTSSEVVLDTCLEQAVELDYILPDYYPDIFRIMKCKVMPRVVSHTISADDKKKITCEITAPVRIWYLTENSNYVNCIEQKLTFTKSAELMSECDNPSVSLSAKTDYINCRVINQRRIDIRGAISLKIKVNGEKKQSFIVGSNGGGIQLKKSFITYPAKRLVSTKRVTVIEELELGTAKPPIKSVIRADSEISSSEFKIISGKLVTKGEASVNMLYTCSRENGESVESMKFSVPFSQVLDMEQIDEHFDALLDITVTGCDISTKGVSKSEEFECELGLLLNCTAYKYETSEVVTDAYSTSYDSTYEVCETKLENMPVSISGSEQIKAQLSSKDGKISCVYDVWAEMGSVTSCFNHDNGEFIINGKVILCCMAANENGCPIYLETENVFEHSLPWDKSSTESSAEPKVKILSISYNLIDDENIEVKAEIDIGGFIRETTVRNLISEIKVDSESKKEDGKGYALKLYYADADEDIWEIAKRYSTSVAAICEENDITGDRVAEKTMLLIPIIS